MNDRLVWIDCEMTGLDLVSDALVEIAALVTDSELNLLGEGVTSVIRPPDAAWSRCCRSCREMHTSLRPARRNWTPGITLAEAEKQVLDYIRAWVPERRQGPAGRELGRHRPRLPGPGHAGAGQLPALPDRRRLQRQGAGPSLVPAGVLQRPGEGRRPPGAGRHPGEHPGAAVLPRGGVRPPARPGHGRREGHRGRDQRRTGPGAPRPPE